MEEQPREYHGNPVKHLALYEAIADYAMPHDEKAILMCLCRFGNYDGTRCAPSQQRLAKANDMSLIAVKRVFKALRDKGFIEATCWLHRCKVWTISVPPKVAEQPKEKPARKPREKKQPVVPAPVVETPVVPDVVGASEPPPLTPEQIAKRHADKERVLAQLQRR